MKENQLILAFSLTTLILIILNLILYKNEDFAILIASCQIFIFIYSLLNLIKREENE